jgi:hypothetical protein
MNDSDTENLRQQALAVARERELENAILIDEQARQNFDRDRLFADEPQVRPRSLSASIGPVPERNMFDGPAYSGGSGVVRSQSRQSRQPSRQTEFVPNVITNSQASRRSAVIRSSRDRQAAPEALPMENDVNQVTSTPSYFEEPIAAPACRFAPSRRSNMQ